MMIVLSLLIFTTALTAVVAVFAFTLAPAMPRIVALLAGERDPAAVLRPQLLLSDRRARVPAMAMAPVPHLARAAA